MKRMLLLAIAIIAIIVSLNAQDTFYKSPSSGQIIQISVYKNAPWATDTIQRLKTQLDQLGFVSIPMTQSPNKEIRFGTNPGSLKGKSIVLVVHISKDEVFMCPIKPKDFQPAFIAMALR